MESLRITDGAPGLTALVGRATGLDASASARFQSLDADAPAVDVYVTTPFDCIASRRVSGEASDHPVQDHRGSRGPGFRRR